MGHSISATTGISVALFEPPQIGLTWIRSFRGEIMAYEHSKGRLGGHLSASLSIGLGQADAETFFDKYLGYKIVAYNDVGLVMWEGFINMISLSLNGFSVSVGPLVDISNKVKVKYTTIRYNTNPPIGGQPRETDYTEDFVSQQRYGIIEKVLAGGSMQEVQSELVRDVYLEENAYPAVSQGLQFAGTGEPQLKLDCVGYVQWLDMFEYEMSGTGTWDISDKLIDVLGSEPNGFIDTDPFNIRTNTDQVPVYEEEGHTGFSVIKDLVARGDSSNRFYEFAVVKDRKVRYRPIANEVYYLYKLGNKGRYLTDIVGGEIKPWNVEFGRWLYITDFMVGKSRDEELRKDTRAMLIESTRYTAPFGLTINGTRVRTLPQIMARYGLSGI